MNTDLLPGYGHTRMTPVLSTAPARCALGCGLLFALALMILPAGSEWRFAAQLQILSGFFMLLPGAALLTLAWSLPASAASEPRNSVYLGAVLLLAVLPTLSHVLFCDAAASSASCQPLSCLLSGQLLTAVGLLGYTFLPTSAGKFRFAWFSLALLGLLSAALSSANGRVSVLPSSTGIICGLLVLLYGLAAWRLLRHRDSDRTLHRRWLACAAWVMALAAILAGREQSALSVLGALFQFAAAWIILHAFILEALRPLQQSLHDERALRQAVMNAVPDMILLRDRNGSYQSCNEAFSRCHGILAQDLQGLDESRLVASGRLPSMLLSGSKRQEGSEAEWVESADGELRLFETILQPLHGDDGKPLGDIRISRDISERRRLREQGAEREQRLLAALQGASLGIWDWHIPSGQMNFSPTWAKMLGLDPETVLPHVTSLEARMHGDDWAAIQDVLAAHFHGKTDSYRVAFRLRHAEGHWIWVQDSGRVLERDAQGSPLRAVGLHEDISSRKAMEESLLHLATTDPLTGLWNRRQFTEMVNSELGRVRRQGPAAGLLVLDLDHFKRINDTYGHAAGDEVLKHFSGLISCHLREIDVFARLGGEEFGVLLPGVNDADGALRAANRLRDLIADHPATVEGQPLPFSMSIGVTMLEAADEAFDAVFARADVALYQAKAAGRNRAVLQGTATASAAD